MYSKSTDSREKALEKRVEAKKNANLEILCFLSQILNKKRRNDEN